MTDVLSILWFDTEDFITPETDDMPMRIAKLMERHGIKVVFKLVGEKLRALQKRNRKDVLDAISKHDIGYHSNLHSIHPIMSEYVGNLDWDRGALEFEKRERQGYEEIVKIFGRNTCFGHPGLSWVPQVYPVLTKWGINVYLDENFTLQGVNERPFWYGNMLNIMCLRSNVLTLDSSGPYNAFGAGVAKLVENFKKVYRKIESEGESGVISVFCHPTTYATKEFWDALNFSKGKNPPVGKYMKPPLKSKEEIDKDFKDLERFLNSISDLPNLWFITAEDALEIYHDKAVGRAFSKAEVMDLARRSLASINYYRVEDGVWLSSAEIFSLVISSLAEYARSAKLPDRVFASSPFGPKREHLTNGEQDNIQVQGYLRLCEKKASEIRSSRYLPSNFEVDGIIISTQDMFATACRFYLEIFEGKKPETIPLTFGHFEVGNLATLEGAKRDWGYYLSPEGFEAQEQLRLAKLQLWTLKPASADLERLRRFGRRLAASLVVQ